MKPVWIHAVAWIGLAILAILNAALREKIYGRSMTERSAHQLSTLSLAAIVAVYAYGLARQWPLASIVEAWSIGILWLTSTIAFEFLFGHYVLGTGWSRLLRDYDLSAGRVWGLFLLWTAIVPPCVYSLI